MLLEEVRWYVRPDIAQVVMKGGMKKEGRSVVCSGLFQQKRLQLEIVGQLS